MQSNLLGELFSEQVADETYPYPYAFGSMKRTETETQSAEPQSTPSDWKLALLPLISELAKDSASSKELEELQGLMSALATYYNEKPQEQSLRAMNIRNGQS